MRDGTTGIDVREQLPSSPLSQEGEKSVLRSVQKLLPNQDIKKIVSSPFERAKQSALLASSVLSVIPVFEKGLSEIDLWVDDENDKDQVNKVAKVMDKKAPILKEFLDTYLKDQDNILVSAHGNVIRVFLHVLLGYSLNQVRGIDIDNASVTCLSVLKKDGLYRASLEYLNRVG